MSRVESSPRKRLLLMGTVWPELTSSAAGARHFQLLRLLKQRGWDIHFTTTAVEKPEWVAKLTELGIPSQVMPANDSRIENFLKTLQPDFVIFDRFMTEEQFGWRVRECCPQAVRVLDTVDLHSLRRAREAAASANSDAIVDFNPLANTASAHLSTDTLRELSAIYRSDLSLLISDFELRLLKNELQVPSQLLALYRFTYPKPQPERRLPFQERRGYAMIGNFRHPPNADATRWLKRELWPRIRARDPEAQVAIYGAYPSKEIMSLTSPREGFHVLGPAADAFEVLGKARVNLAPLRFGAGLKGKIADGWWAGTPAVTTAIGAEGMQIEGEAFGGRIAASAEEFAAQAVALAQSPQEWRHAQQAGDRILAELFDEQNEIQPLEQVLLSAQTHLQARRATNVTGQMLWHHTARSTEYFSRWIELKEKSTAAGSRD
jgi:hypothetical protein